MEHVINLLNTHKINFEYTKKGVNLMSNDEEWAFIEHWEDWEVYPDDYWKKAMKCFLCNNKGHTKEDSPKNKRNNNNKKKTRRNHSLQRAQ